MKYVVNYKTKPLMNFDAKLSPMKTETYDFDEKEVNERGMESMVFNTKGSIWEVIYIFNYTDEKGNTTVEREEAVNSKGYIDVE